jgi:catechol 2,3-dioxygenase-like lactoylglutathione lyase family enzyme
MAKLPTPTEGIALTYFIVSRDVERSRRFYTDVLGGEAVLEGEPSIVALANGWITINVGGGPTDDKPTVTLEPPSDPNRASAFLNIRVADIKAIYEEWSARGAEFLTPPIDRGSEIRCYMRDPDGHSWRACRANPRGSSYSQPRSVAIRTACARSIAPSLPYTL